VVQHLPVDVQDEFGHGGRSPRALGRPARPGETGSAQAPHTRHPASVNRVELGQRRGGVARIAVRGVVERRPAEVRRYPHAEHADDDVPEPPGDRGHRGRVRLRYGVVDGELARPHRERHRSRSARPHVPRARHRLPPVLRVGHPLEAGAQLPAPVPVQLLGQLEVPVNIGHAAQPKKQPGQFPSAIARHDGQVTDTAARLLRLLPLLTARPSWRGDELAARLGVTTRTVRRDVDRRTRRTPPGSSARASPPGRTAGGPGSGLRDRCAALADRLRQAATRPPPLEPAEEPADD
jgi:hypothetical protein